MLDAQGLEQAIQGCRRHLEQVGAHVVCQVAVLVFVMRQPDRDRRLQSFAAQLITGEPDAFQGLQQHLGLIFPFGAWTLSCWSG